MESTEDINQVSEYDELIESSIMGYNGNDVDTIE